MPLERLALEAEHLAKQSEDLLRTARWSRWQRVFVLTSIVFMLALLLLQVSLTLGNRTTYAAIKDCTQPSSSPASCYRRSQVQQAHAIDQIVTYNLAASWCTAHERTYSDAQRCVIKLTKPGG